MLILYTILVVALLFSFSIFIHELGHFLVARWFGMKIDAFAIGFGPPIYSKVKNGVHYKIGLIPFGGYVALPQMDPNNDQPTPGAEPIPYIAPYKKIPVALAGAVGNIIFAFFLAWIISIIGKPSAPHERDTVVGYVNKDSVAFEQGLRPGHRILSVNGEDVHNWNDIMVAATLAREVSFTADAHGETLDLHISTLDTDLGVRLIPGISWFGYCDVGQIVPGSSAEQAGLQPGDRLLALNGVTLYSQAQLIDLVNTLKNQTVPLKFRRGDAEVMTMVTPAYDAQEKRALIGIMFNQWAVDFDQVIHPRPVELVREFSTLIFKVLGALVTPSTSGMAASALAGPVFILKSLWDMVQNSFAMALWFTCLLNVNLAVLNLMPIPVLDGGHVVFSLWEMITRRPINTRFKVGLMSLCWMLLIAAMLFLAFRDVSRLGWIKRSSSSAPVEEVAPAMDESLEQDVIVPESLPSEP